MADQSQACEPATDPEGICQVVGELHRMGRHGSCRTRDCEWQRSTGQVVRAAAARVITESGLPLAVVGVSPAGEVLEVRAFHRAQQAKPYRTRLGASIDPDPTPPLDREDRWDRAKCFAFVLCDQGHFV